LKDAPGWGFTSGERSAILLICAAALIGIGYRLYQQSAIPESAPITAQDSAAIAAISKALELQSKSPERTTGGDSSTEAVLDPSHPISGNPGLIDLNSATQAQLETLPGVGPVLARRILETRAHLGGYQHLEQLLEVPGIAKVRLERIRPLVICRSSDSLSNLYSE
jgi:competence protein ComEA